MGGRPGIHAYLGPTEGSHVDGNVLEDNSADENENMDLKRFNKHSDRHASEDSRTKGGKKGELRCDTCGKCYKHSSCLTKHMYVLEGVA